MFICDSWCNCSWNDMPLFISSSYFIIHILYFTAVLHDSLEKDMMLFLLKCAIRHNKEIDNYNILILPLPNPSVTLSLSFTIYCPSASSSKYPGPGPLSGLTPLAHWNLSRNQNWGISELSMTLVTRIRLATSTYTWPLSVPRQNHQWSVMQISGCAAKATYGEAGSYQWWRFIYNWHHQSSSSLWPL